MLIAMLDDHFDSTNANIDQDSFMALSFAPGADLSWLAMGLDLGLNNDPDPNFDQAPTFQAHSSLEVLEEDFEPDEDPDEGDTSEVHPCLETPEDSSLKISGQGSLHIGIEDSDSVNLDNDSSAACADNLPDLVKRLQEQLLAGYIIPNHPSVDDPRAHKLSKSEEHSLRHYIAWVDSCGTVKAYNLHAEVLRDAAQIEILTLYKVRKLTMKLLGLSSQMVDMCPKSCMAFTGNFKDLQFCTYIRDKKAGACGEPRFDKKGQPRAQMVYNPIAPIIQSFYGNREMAQAMRYRHQSLQNALKKLEPDCPPTVYSDFSDSINHIDHINHLHLFQQETDTAITISGDSAQLTMKKQSDVWVLIVTILNLPPNMRSKASNIIMPLVIPGPHSPGNVESFVYVLYEELAKLSVGVWAWDALSETYFILRVYLCGVLGDMLGSAKLSKMAGHMAVYGCRFCAVKGARASDAKGIILYYTLISVYLIIFSI